MQQKDMRPGDVAADSGGQFWKRGDNPWDWNTFDGAVLHYGEWKAEYGPQGDLTLLWRDGKPVPQPYQGRHESGGRGKH